MALHDANIETCTKFYTDYCGLKVIDHRHDSASTVVWLAEDAKSDDFITVLISHGAQKKHASNDFSHLGFALDSIESVNALATKAREQGCLVWEPREEPYPLGYYCGIQDPNGNVVEFSFGQPLGDKHPTFL